MLIEITTFDRRAEFDLMGTRMMRQGLSVDLGEAVVRFEGTLVRKADGFPNVIRIAIDIAVGVTAQVAANFVWDFLKKRLKTPPVALSIDRQTIELEEGYVKRFVIEHIEERSDGS